MSRSSALVVVCALALPAAAQEVPRESRFPSQLQLEQFLDTRGAAPGGATPPPAVNRTTMELVKTFEGWEPVAYDDPVGLCTIGYGHLIANKRCVEITLPEDLKGTLTPQQGEAILEKDMRGARQAVLDLVSVEINPDQFGALVSFTFNVGKLNLAKSTLLKRVNEGLMDHAVDEMARWVTAKKKILPGLVSRRSCEQMLFKSLISLDDKGRFDRSQCDTRGAAPIAGKLIDVEEGE